MCEEQRSGHYCVIRGVVRLNDKPCRCIVGQRLVFSYPQNSVREMHLYHFKCLIKKLYMKTEVFFSLRRTKRRRWPMGSKVIASEGTSTSIKWYEKETLDTKNPWKTLQIISVKWFLRIYRNTSCSGKKKLICVNSKVNDCT